MANRVAMRASGFTRRWTGVVALGLGSWMAHSFVTCSLRPAGRDSSRTTRGFFNMESKIVDREPMKVSSTHFITGGKMYPPWPEGMEQAMFGMGCFWCSENLYMKMKGVYSTQVGYAGGKNKNPNYDDCCTGQSGHVEAVRVIYDPKVVSYAELLKVFWERHDPTTLNQQGGDRGTQYRSGIYYYSPEQLAVAEKTRAKFQQALGGRQIVTEILPAPEFYYGEDYHQQYDAKPGSRKYCGLQPSGKTMDLSGI